MPSAVSNVHTEVTHRKREYHEASWKWGIIVRLKRSLQTALLPRSYVAPSEDLTRSQREYYNQENKGKIVRNCEENSASSLSGTSSQPYGHFGQCATIISFNVAFHQPGMANIFAHYVRWIYYCDIPVSGEGKVWIFELRRHLQQGKKFLLISKSNNIGVSNNTKILDSQPRTLFWNLYGIELRCTNTSNITLNEKNTWGYPQKTFQSNCGCANYCPIVSL